MMDAYEAYGLFLALRAHFNQKSYNYFRYNGKVKTNFEKFLDRKDRFFFGKLAKHQDPKNYVLANMIEDPKIWVSDLFDSIADENYTDWKKRNGSLSYLFSEEMDYLKKEGSLDDVLKVKGGQYPILLDEYLSGTIMPESMIIINELTSAFKYWNKKITDNVVWPETYLKLKKYRDFMTIDDKNKEQYRKIILDKFSNL